MGVNNDLVGGFNKIVDKAGQQLRIRNFNIVLGSVWDDEAVVLYGKDNLLSHDTGYVYTFSGLSNSVTGSIASPGGDILGIEVDNDQNLIVTTANPNFTYTHQGVSSTLTGSFSNPTPSPNDITSFAVDSSNNLIIATASPGFIYQLSGISNTVTGSFAAGGGTSTSALAIKDGDLISANRIQDSIYLYSGISSTLTGSFATESGEIRGLSVDVKGNLISCDIANEYFYFHSGISSTLTGSSLSQVSFQPGGLANDIGDSETWISGVVLPLDKREGSEDSVLLQQGKLIDSDKRLYTNGSINYTGSSNIVDIMIGSPTGDLYTTIEDGGIVWGAEGIPVYKKQFVRRLTTGSLLKY